MPDDSAVEKLLAEISEGDPGWKIHRPWMIERLSAAVEADRREGPEAGPPSMQGPVGASRTNETLTLYGPSWTIALNEEEEFWLLRALLYVEGREGPEAEIELLNYGYLRGENEGPLYEVNVLAGEIPLPATSHLRRYRIRIPDSTEGGET